MLTDGTDRYDELKDNNKFVSVCLLAFNSVTQRGALYKTRQDEANRRLITVYFAHTLYLLQSNSQNIQPLLLFTTLTEWGVFLKRNHNVFCAVRTESL